MAGAIITSMLPKVQTRGEQTVSISALRAGARNASGFPLSG